MIQKNDLPSRLTATLRITSLVRLTVAKTELPTVSNRCSIGSIFRVCDGKVRKALVSKEILPPVPGSSLLTFE